jgi:hypothetical protein
MGRSRPDRGRCRAPGLPPFALSHITEGEWRAQFSAHPLWASAGYGVAATPWRAVQVAARAAVNNDVV